MTMGDRTPALRDYRLTGPDEAREIIRTSKECETKPNGTGLRCTCRFPCANYFLRARGFKGNDDGTPGGEAA